MTTSNDSEPIVRLMTLGDCREYKQWPDYLSLGLGPEHIPELIRIATDQKLLWADGDEPELWAPIHAWRALGYLRAEAAIEPLIQEFHEGELGDGIREWIDDSMPRVFEMIGPPAVPALAAYLANTRHDMWARITAATCLEHIANKHRAARPQCVAAIVSQLEKFRKNDPTFNGLLISSLIDMDETEPLPLIERAYQADCVDETVNGDFQEVRQEFGLKPASGIFDAL